MLSSSRHFASWPRRAARRLAFRAVSGLRSQPPARPLCAPRWPGWRSSPRHRRSRPVVLPRNPRGHRERAPPLPSVSRRGERAGGRPARVLQPVLQALQAALEAFVDRGRRGGQATLQDLQRETDILPPLLVAQRLFGPVHLLAHVVRHGVVERPLQWRQLVFDRVGAAFREKRRAVETVQLLLRQSAHQVGRVHLVAIRARRGAPAARRLR